MKLGMDIKAIDRLSYDIDNPEEWLDTESFTAYAASHEVGQLARLLLLSDGSLTRLLQALFLTDVSFQVKSQQVAPLTAEVAGFLEVDADLPAISREVWLGRAGQEKLVYAHAAVLIDDIDDGVYHEIATGEMPLGALITQQGLPDLRDKLAIGIVRSARIAAEMGVPASQPMWARVYRITSGGSLTTAILEIFSPLVFQAGEPAA